MRQSLQIELIRRALKHLSEKTTDRESSTARASSFYLSPDQCQRERETLFRRFPLVAGYSSQLAKAGAYLLFEFGDQSILITRDAQGELHAMANFCAHRGTKIVDSDAASGPTSGNAQRFTCPYHAWTYDGTGKLVGLPHSEDFPQCSEYRLATYPVGERYGLIWVKPTVGASMDLTRELGKLSEDLEGFGFGTHVRFAPRMFRSPINWKLMVEGSLETYHFKYTHRNTIAPMFFDNLGVFDWEGPHARMLLPKQEIRSLPKDENSWKIREVGNLIYFFFPNTILLVQPDHATLMSSFPISERESWIHGATLIPEAPENPKAEAHWNKNVEIYWNAIMEDFAMSERIQLGLNSGAVSELRFGRSEFLVHRFQEQVDLFSG